MFAALLTTLLFSLSVVSASRSVRLIGGPSANFWRLVVATALLAAWAHGFGVGTGGGQFLVFFLSGMVGFGLGDTALFLALPRLGPRLTVLLINCLAAPFAALIEWAWLGTRLTFAQMLWGSTILAGVSLALAPSENLHLPPRALRQGVVWGTVAAFGQGLGAVLSRRAFLEAAAAGQSVDGGSAAYQRILGGLLITVLPYAWHLWRQRLSNPAPPTAGTRSAAVFWVMMNALSGPSLGVACYQWALKTTPSGIVLPIVATTPLAIIPFSYYLEGDRPGWRSLAGGVVAVVGAALLASAR